MFVAVEHYRKLARSVPSSSGITKEYRSISDSDLMSDRSVVMAMQDPGMLRCALILTAMHHSRNGTQDSEEIHQVALEHKIHAIRNIQDLISSSTEPLGCLTRIAALVTGEVIISKIMGLSSTFANLATSMATGTPNPPINSSKDTRS